MDDGKGKRTAVFCVQHFVDPSIHHWGSTTTSNYWLPKAKSYSSYVVHMLFLEICRNFLGFLWCCHIDAHCIHIKNFWSDYPTQKNIYNVPHQSGTIDGDCSYSTADQARSRCSCCFPVRVWCKVKNYWSESGRGFTNLLKGTLTVVIERKETVNHSLHAQMISSDLQHPTTPTFLMSLLINMLILSSAVLYSKLEVEGKNKGET